MKKCLVEGCENKYRTKGYCTKHLFQIKKYGEIRTRTMRDKNEFEVLGDHTKVFVYDRLSNISGSFIIDTEDLERCRKYKWCVMSKKSVRQFYIMNAKAGKLHAFILRYKTNSKMHIDHIDGNTMNNRKSNLQICTNQQNQLKKKMQSNNTSGYRGVTWYVNPGKTSRWMAQIYFNHKRHHIGYFDSKEEAALAYNEKAKEFFGDFAVLNKVKG